MGLVTMYTYACNQEEKNHESWHVNLDFWLKNVSFRFKDEKILEVFFGQNGPNYAENGIEPIQPIILNKIIPGYNKFIYIHVCVSKSYR